MREYITVPWDVETVAALNAYQRYEKEIPGSPFPFRTHPFTCDGDRMDDAHRAYQAVHGGDFGELVATPEGWLCPVCGYRQNWAHGFMATMAKDRP